MPKNKLSVLLIKKNTPLLMVVKQQEDIHSEEVNGCMFYYKNSFTNPPKWLASFFNNSLACGERLRSTSAAGVLLVRRDYAEEQRIFAICFGFGRSLIQPACIEERFGLITALNCINAEELRSVDINRLDSSSLKSRIQSTKLAGVADLEFDVEKSLLRQATGLSNDEEMGKTVSGSDALTISVEADIDNIGDILDHCYAKYTSSAYRQAFSWVDHISPIKRGALIETLDELLIANLLSDEESKTWLAVPEIISWEDITTLRFGENGVEHSDILMEDFGREVIATHEISIPYLKHNAVYAYDDNGYQKYRWPYYKCIYSEIEHEGCLYMLNAGSWYNVDRDYVAEIQQAYSLVPISNLPFINYNHDSENAYNTALANSSPDFHLMDVNLIPTGVSRNNLEFCDVYHRTGKMIHIKKYGGSQVIGHLFNQGRVFGSLLFVKDIRDKVNEQLPEGWKFPDGGFNPGNYEIVYGIISKYTDERPHIPFFSMVVFNDVYRTLTGFGYSVSLKTILNERG